MLDHGEPDVELWLAYLLSRISHSLFSSSSLHGDHGEYVMIIPHLGILPLQGRRATIAMTLFLSITWPLFTKSIPLPLSYSSSRSSSYFRPARPLGSTHLPTTPLPTHPHLALDSHIDSSPLNIDCVVFISHSIQRKKGFCFFLFIFLISQNTLAHSFTDTHFHLHLLPLHTQSAIHNPHSYIPLATSCFLETGFLYLFFLFLTLTVSFLFSLSLCQVWEGG